MNGKHEYDPNVMELIEDFILNMSLMGIKVTELGLGDGGVDRLAREIHDRMAVKSDEAMVLARNKPETMILQLFNGPLSVTNKEIT
jgi:hypothetical protein